MKKILLAFIVAFSLISCSISEQIIFNADGSGKLAYTIDMSKMIAITKDLDKSNRMTKDLTESTAKDMDTVIHIKDILAQRQKEGKEITPEQLANMEQMKNYSMRMVVNKAKSEMKYVMATDFKNISEVGNIGAALTTMKDLSGKKTGAFDATKSDGNSDVKYVIDGKSFSRTVIEKPYVEEVVEEEVYEEAVDTAVAIEDYDYDSADSLALENLEEVSEEMEALESDENAEEEKEMTKEEIKKMNKDFEKLGKMMEEGMKDSAFEFQYTFAKRIKKVSLKKSEYKLSDDKKTIFIKYQVEEFTKKIKDFNLNIEFE